jgi:uncharacterized protein (DUF2252 family)
MDHNLINPNDRDIWQLIQAFDRQRDPNILAKKYTKMRKDAFVFCRGTCHLFYRDFPIDSSLNLAPATWICGDLHVENFGTYKGDNRQIYFGINDFDEGVLAPCTWDIARLLTSIFLAVDSLSLVGDSLFLKNQSSGQQLAESFLNSYADELTTGRIAAIGEDNTQGIVADLLQDIQRRKRSELLNERTKLIKSTRQLKFDTEKILKVSRQRQERVTQAISSWAKTQINPDFFEVLDVGFRLAGTGSLGVDRYLILVAGKDSPDRNYLLDFKQQLNSSLQPYLSNEQPQWINQATRVMKAQQLVQPAPPAVLAAIEFNGNSYLLRELQPTQDKIELKAGKISLEQLAELIKTIAQATALAHLHGSGKLGAAPTQDLIGFGQNSDWQEQVLNYAINYVSQVQLDYQDFCKATQDL